MNDVMLDEASLWLNEHEPPLHKQKLEAPPSPVEDVYFSDEEDMNHEEQEKYRLQVVESCGKKLQLKSGLKVNAEIGSLYNSYSTSEVMDPVNNSLHTFQTLVTDAGKMNKARLILVTKICRIKPQVPGIGDANGRWDFDAIDDFYKGDMPDWPLNDEFTKGDKLLQFYEVKESELRDNEWISLYAEAALFSEWHSDMSVPFEMKKVVVQTKEDVESSMKLKSSNAIFYMTFKVREGPDCRGIVRKTSDGRTGHMRLEARCWIDK